MDAIYVVIRRDLNMRRGKEIAQACHAVLNLGSKDTAIIGCKLNSKEALEDLECLCRVYNINHFVVTDAAKTELREPTQTCIAIGPVEKGKFGFLNELELY